MTTETTETTARLLDEFPVDYYSDTLGGRAQIRLIVEDGEDIADLRVEVEGAEIAIDLRLDRDELAALIATAARAMALLS